jgi:hypothetical protein
MTNASAGLRPSQGGRSWFYVWMAAACTLLAFGGFAPTFWLQLAPGTFVGSPLLHLHALLFSLWPLFLLGQTSLVAAGRPHHHRAWGLAGISLATAMVFVGFAVGSAVLTTRVDAGYGDKARAFHIVSTSMILMFGAFVAAAIACATRPEAHKRLMLLATVAMLPPAIARIFFAINVGIGAGMRPGLGPPRTVESVTLPALITDLLILVAIIHDWRTRGRPHVAYVVGGGVMLAVQFLRVPLSATDGWYSVADFLARFAG